MGLLINDGGDPGSQIDKTILGEYVLIESEILLGLPGYQITGIERIDGEVRISARYTGPKSCAHCGAVAVRSKGRFRVYQRSSSCKLN